MHSLNYTVIQYTEIYFTVYYQGNGILTRTSTVMCNPGITSPV